MIMYKIISVNSENRCIVKNSEGELDLYIPLDEGNVDYQDYLKWVAEGNTPEQEDIIIPDTYEE